MGYDWISFTTDYGAADGFVAACRGVLARIAPTAGVIDVTHLVPAQDVRRGARVLAQTAPYLPDAVHLAVVDPGVGTSRRPVAVLAGRGVLVGPDNGLLLPAAAALGGVLAAVELTDPAYHLPPVSRTFHGRDLFAPVAAHLANGVEPAALGRSLDVADLVRLPDPVRTVRPGRIVTEIVSCDGFGNVQLAATSADLAAAGLVDAGNVQVRVGSGVESVALGGTFGDVDAGAAVLFEDSAGLLALAVRDGSAAARYDVRPGGTVELSA